MWRIVLFVNFLSPLQEAPYHRLGPEKKKGGSGSTGVCVSARDYRCGVTRCLSSCLDFSEVMDHCGPLRAKINPFSLYVAFGQGV